MLPEVSDSCTPLLAAGPAKPKSRRQWRWGPAYFLVVPVMLLEYLAWSVSLSVMPQLETDCFGSKAVVISTAAKGMLETTRQYHQILENAISVSVARVHTIHFPQTMLSHLGLCLLFGFPILIFIHLFSRIAVCTFRRLRNTINWAVVSKACRNEFIFFPLPPSLPRARLLPLSTQPRP